MATQFNPTDFNAESIVKLAKAVGMKYLVITSKHHDGFAMYDSPCSKFNIMDAMPFKRDVVRELYDACNKHGIDFGDFDIPGDNKIPTNSNEITKPWQTVGTLNNSWGYKSYDNDWKSVKELIFWLTEIVSKGGNYMLNIGPDAMSNVPQQCTDNLLELGKWIDINGDAIYGTSRWIKSHEGPTNLVMKGTGEREKEKFKAEFTPQDFWFTAKENLVYAIAIEYPEDKVAVVKALNTSSDYMVKSVKLLGYEQTLSFEQKEDGLIVSLPETQPNPNGYALEISVVKNN